MCVCWGGCQTPPVAVLCVSMFVANRLAQLFIMSSSVGRLAGSVQRSIKLSVLAAS